MRTTVDLDADLLQRLRTLAVTRKVSFKDLLNEALRRALASHEAPALARYVMPTARMGVVREGINLDKAHSLVDAIEAVEVAHEFERGK